MLKVKDKSSLWRKFSNNLDKHGEDDFTAFDVPGSMELDAGEVCDLFDDKLMHKRLFDSPSRGKPATVGDGFNKVGPLKFRDTFEDCKVDAVLSGTAHHFEGVKVSKIMLTPCHGGSTEMDYMMHLKPNTDKQILLLLHHQRRNVVISIDGGKQVAGKAQQDLELDPKEDGGEDGKPEANGKDPRPIGGPPPDNVQPIR